MTIHYFQLNLTHEYVESEVAEEQRSVCGTAKRIRSALSVVPLLYETDQWRTTDCKLCLETEAFKEDHLVFEIGCEGNVAKWAEYVKDRPT